jgi:CheY-like chemotaxis protein
MSKKILVIDDEEVIRKSFKLALEGLGYDVMVLESGQKGIDEIKKTPYNLIFLDLKMPGMDGVATLRGLRQVDMNVPIYIVTAFHKDFLEGLQKAAKDGMNFELLEKPIPGSLIAVMTRSILERKIGF